MSFNLWDKKNLLIRIFFYSFASGVVNFKMAGSWPICTQKCSTSIGVRLLKSTSEEVKPMANQMLLILFWFESSEIPPVVWIFELFSSKWHINIVLNQVESIIHYWMIWFHILGESPVVSLVILWTLMLSTDRLCETEILKGLSTCLPLLKFSAR